MDMRMALEIFKTFAYTEKTKLSATETALYEKAIQVLMHDLSR